MNKAEYEEGEFRNKTKQKQNEIKQQNYKKKLNFSCSCRPHESVWQGVGIAPFILLIGITQKGVSNFTLKPL